MKKQEITVKEIIDSIPAKFGLDATQLDLSTPEKAYNFLTDSNSPLFTQGNISHSIFNNAECSTVILETGYKSMYDANNLFAETSTKKDELQKKYGVTEVWQSELSVSDEDGYLEWATWSEEDLHNIKDNNWPFRLGFDEFGKFDEFVELVRKICIANNEWAKITMDISYETYCSIDISEDGTVVNNIKYEVIDDEDGAALVYSLAFLLEVFMCDTFEAFNKYAPRIILK